METIIEIKLKIHNITVLREFFHIYNKNRKYKLKIK